MSMKHQWQKSSEELQATFLKTMEHFEEAEPRKMFGYPCFFINGNLFTGLHEENWILRLNEPDREKMKEKYGARPFEPLGRSMKEYLIIPDELKHNKPELLKWIEISKNFAAKVPPRKKGRARLNARRD